MKQDMKQDMKHNDMKRNNEMRDTVFMTRRHHGYCGQLLRSLLILMVMMTVGATEAWGDDYTFYVINNNEKESVCAKATVETTSTVLDAFKTTSIVSPFITDENYYFYDTEEEAIAATGLTNGGGNGSNTVATIDAGDDKNIYVRYYYNASLSPTPIDFDHNTYIYLQKNV